MVGFVDITDCLNHQEIPRSQSPDPTSRLAEVLQRLDSFVEKADNTKKDSNMADVLQATSEDWEVDDDEEEEAYTPPLNSFFHLPQNNKSSVALSLLHTASTENSLRRIEESSSNHTDDEDNLQLPKVPSNDDTPSDDFPAILEAIAETERRYAAQHLRQARSRIRQEGNSEKVKGIESPPHARPRIPAMERTFEPREDPKAQLLGVMFGDPTWSGKQILDEVEVEVMLERRR